MDRFALDEKGGIPIWIQIRNRLIYLIKSGEYKPGDQLPTVRELAIELKINYNTVNKVYRSLETDGIIESRRGRGTFVSDVTEAIVEMDHSPVTVLADELVAKAKENGMTLQDLTVLVEERYLNEGL